MYAYIKLTHCTQQIYPTFFVNYTSVKLEKVDDHVLEQVSAGVFGLDMGNKEMYKETLSQVKIPQSSE